MDAELYRDGLLQEELRHEAFAQQYEHNFKAWLNCHMDVMDLTPRYPRRIELEQGEC